MSRPSLSLASVFLLVLMVACGGGGGSTVAVNTDNNQVTNPPGDTGEGEQGGEGGNSPDTVDNNGFFPVQDHHLLNHKLTLGGNGVYGSGFAEYDYYFYENNLVHFVPRSSTTDYPVTRPMQWRTDGQYLYVNNGTTNTGVIWESPQRIAFTQAPQAGQTVAFSTGTNDLFVSASIEAFHAIDPLQAVELSSADIIGWTYEFDSGADPDGLYKTTIAFNADFTANYSSISGSQRIQWEFSGPAAIKLSGFSSYPTSLEYEFLTYPVNVGDEVRRTTTDGVGQTADVSVNSTFLVARYQTPGINFQLSDADFAGMTYEFDTSGRANNPYRTTLILAADHTGTMDSVAGENPVAWQILPPDTLRVEITGGYGGVAHKDYIFTRMPEVGDVIYRSWLWEDGHTSESATVLVNLVGSD